MRKKIFFTALCSLCTILGFAQTQKGTIVAHFNVGDIRSLSVDNKGSIKNNFIGFNPGGGIFIKDNWEVGISFNYISLRYKNDHTNYLQNSNTIGINAYTNYYFGKGKLKPYATLQTGWEKTKGNFTTNGVQQDFKGRNFYAGIGGGLNWNINSKVSLFSEATYRKNQPFNPNGKGYLNLTVGVRFFFNKKHRAN